MHNACVADNANRFECIKQLFGGTFDESWCFRRVNWKAFFFELQGECSSSTSMSSGDRSIFNTSRKIKLVHAWRRWRYIYKKQPRKTSEAFELWRPENPRWEPVLTNRCFPEGLQMTATSIHAAEGCQTQTTSRHGRRWDVEGTLLLLFYSAKSRNVGLLKSDVYIRSRVNINADRYAWKEIWTWGACLLSNGSGYSAIHSCCIRLR